MPDKPVLDLSRLQEAFEDDVDGIAGLLELALATGMKHLRTLREALGNGDIAAVSRAAHSIKGSASNIGANLTAHIASDIETRARAENLDGIAALTDDLERAYAVLGGRIAAYRAEIT